MRNPECLAFEGYATRSATVCARFLSHLLLLELDHWRRVAHRDLDISLSVNWCRRVVNVLPDAMIGVSRHRLMEVSSRQRRYDRKHFTAGQSHVPPTVKRHLCKGRRPKLRHPHLNHPEIVVRGP